jgi:hypothetical protein
VKFVEEVEEVSLEREVEIRHTVTGHTWLFAEGERVMGRK